MTQHDPELLARLVLDERIDFLELTPSLFTHVADAGVLVSDDESDNKGDRSALAVIGVGGEAVTGALWSRLGNLPDASAYNLYGPTECTVDSLVARLDATERPVVGRPVHNLSAYLLDRRLRPVPPGVLGELYLAGAGLARGYLGRPELTSERFLADPFGPSGTRMYRTGDLARWTAAGQIDFAGRSDDQVKLRGFRIELGEVEAVLGTLPGVTSAAVAVHAERLVGYLTGAADPEAVRSAARAVLPEYMVPATIVLLDALPVSGNGKLDRRALPAPPAVARGSAGKPRTPLEAQLAELFAAVLGLDEVGVDDDLFDLGGHSLLLVQLRARIATDLGVQLPIATLFAHPSVAALAAHLSSSAATTDPINPTPSPNPLPTPNPLPRSPR